MTSGRACSRTPGIGNAGWLPKIARETIAATTLLITTGERAGGEGAEDSSRAKAPASGALKAAEIPAAAPAATSTFTRGAPNRNTRPRAEPMAEPSTATGPSLPAEPPLPSVTALAAVRASTGFVGMCPPRRATAC